MNIEYRTKMKNITKNIVGIIPATGNGSRIGFLPFSKELFPINVKRNNIDIDSPIIIPVINYSIYAMKIANINSLSIIINPNKTDIIKYILDGNHLGIRDLSYKIQINQKGLPSAISIGMGSIKINDIFVLSMPDTIYKPIDSLNKITKKIIEDNCDAVLGLYPVLNVSKFGMVEFDGDLFNYTIDKPQSTNLKYCWGTVVWNYKFAHFINNFVDNSLDKKEILFGDILNIAKNNGFNIRVIPFDNGSYIDIGTIDELENI